MKWSELSMTEKNEVIKMAVAQGIKDISSIKNLYEESVNRSRRFAGGGDIQTTNNRPQDEPQIEWMKNWLSQRRDILQKNAEETTWAYTKYEPRKNTGDVREAGWNYERYLNGWNPITFFKDSNPTRNRVNKLIYSQIENAANTPKQEVGYGKSSNYNMRGVYVEPDNWDNSGNYIAFAGQKVDPATKVHEFTHASHPDQQEQYISNIIFENRDIPKVSPKARNKMDNAKELYGALQEFRYKNGLQPTQKIDQKYLDQNRELFKDNYLEKLSDEDKLRLFNEVASIGKVDLVNTAAQGGPIHIAPSKRGTFTAAASKHGMGVQEFASKVLAHPEDYSLTMRKKANFARNASKWKH